MILSEEFPISTQLGLAMVAMVGIWACCTEVAGPGGGGGTVAGEGGQQPGGSQQGGQQQQHGGRAGEADCARRGSPGWRQSSIGLALGATVTPVLG